MADRATGQPLTPLQQIPRNRTCDLYWLRESKQADNDGEV
jgi:hypothetical protein